MIALGSGGGNSGGAGNGGLQLSAHAAPVPTNHVTGSGGATVSLNGQQATVTLHTNGLLGGSPHAMHIHAGGQGVCPPASAARPHNGHLAISTTNGIQFYGPPQVSLTSHGDTTPKSIVDFSRYPSIGDISYQRTVPVARGVADAIRAGNAVIVVHGIDYNGNHLYDDVLDKSELKSTLPGEATAPALCGPLRTTASAAAGSGSGSGSGGRVYTASLHPYYPALSRRQTSFWLLCHIAGVPLSDGGAGRAEGVQAATAAPA